MVLMVFFRSNSSSFCCIDNGGTNITMLPNVRRYMPCFFPSSKNTLLIDFFVRIGVLADNVKKYESNFGEIKDVGKQQQVPLTFGGPKAEA